MLLVTGGAGFVGGAIVREAVARGLSVISLDQVAGAATPEGCRSVIGDVTDALRLARIIHDEKISMIVHAGASAHLVRAAESPVHTMVVNAVGTANVLEAARLFSVKRVVYISSEAVYGRMPVGGLSDPSASLVPVSAYGVGKAAGDMLARVYRERYGVDAVALRLGEVYGAGLTQDVLFDIAAALTRTGRFDAPHGIEATLQLVEIRDVARAVLQAVQADSFRLPAYNVSGGCLYSMQELLEAFERALSGTEMHVGPGRISGRLVQPAWDISATARDLGWRPEVNLDCGIRDYATWVGGLPTTHDNRKLRAR